MRARRALPVLGAALLAWVPYRAFFGEDVPVARDLLFYFYPLKAHLAEAVARGEIPWVDRYRWGGAPLLSGPSAAAFDPANVLFLLLPTGAAMKAWMLLHLALLVAGFAAFARRLGLGRGAAAVAGLAFALAGTTVSVVPFPPTLSALSVLPWFAAFALDAVRAPSARAAAKAGAAAALVLLASSPEYAVYAAAVALGILLAAPAESPGAPRPARGRALAALAFAGVLAAALSACALIPTASAALDSARGPGGGAAPAAAGALPTARLGELVLDGAVADWSRVGSAPGVPDYPYLPSLTPGRVAWALALVGLALGGPLRVAAALLAGTGVLLALGSATPALGLAAWAIPPLGALRYPERHAALFGFGLATLAALGLSRIDARLGPRSRRVVLPLLAFAILLDRERTARTLSPVDDASALRRPPEILAPLLAKAGASPPRIFHRDLYAPVPAYDTRDLSASNRTAREALLPAYASLFGAGYVFEKDYDLSLSAEAFQWQRLFARALKTESPLPMRFVRAAGANAVLESGRGADGRYRPRLAPVADAVAPFRFATRVVASSDGRAVFARFLEDGAPADTAYVEADLPGLGPPAAGRVLSVKDRPAGLELDVEAAGPGDAVLMAWRLREAAAEARVDGRPVAALPMGFGFTAVRVPPGRHAVTLRPDTRWVKIGVVISAATALGLVFAAARRRRTA